MIVINHPEGYGFERGTLLPVVLPNEALEGQSKHPSTGETLSHIRGEYLGDYFVDRNTYCFRAAEYIPEIDVEEVQGIPSLTGEKFTPKPINPDTPATAYHQDTEAPDEQYALQA